MLRVVLVLALAGCSADSTDAPDLSPAPNIGADSTVTTFDHVLFDSGHRSNQLDVDLPDGLFSSVILHLQLDCPTKCDQWDRVANLRLVDPPVEVARFITPFGVAGTWDVDVTDLQPVLHGTRSFKGFIDTWVAQGSQYGNGWLLTATLEYHGGVPSPEPIDVTPLPWKDFDIGDPTMPIEMSLPLQTVTLADRATHASVRFLVSGHGQGNQDNCGEFCALDHHLLRDGAEVAKTTVWRDDCANNPINNQHGTWKYDRAGWCPGSTVAPWKVDLDAAPSLTLAYSLDTYVNGCSPGACMANACTLGTSCMYDGGAHTPPFYAFSAAVISYR